MLRTLAAVLLSFLAVTPVFAGGLDAAAVNGAAPPAKVLGSDKLNASIVKLQILLDRAHFSPGEIDGKLGENAQKALSAFAETNELDLGKAITPDLWSKLAGLGDGSAIVDYKITNEDLKGPFLKKLPAKMEDMKYLQALNYTSPREALAEKFHMSEELLQAINPGKQFDKAGETIAVANVGQQNSMPIARVEVDKTRQTLKAFDASGKLLAVFPATVGSSEKPTPSGTLRVTAINQDPTYRYNPDYKFKGVKSKKPFTIKPGPNNPVGSTWINLSAEGYGIHGIADPGKVSKSASHGCIRLTNWDARTLSANIKRGTPVVFLDRPGEAATSGQNQPSATKSSRM
jgi:lipoprotein-anchoring transpeptidase ErfK/SrfK